MEARGGKLATQAQSQTRSLRQILGRSLYQSSWGPWRPLDRSNHCPNASVPWNVLWLSIAVCLPSLSRVSPAAVRFFDVARRRVKTRSNAFLQAVPTLNPPPQAPVHHLFRPLFRLQWTMTMAQTPLLADENTPLHVPVGRHGRRRRDHPPLRRFRAQSIGNTDSRRWMERQPKRRRRWTSRLSYKPRRRLPCATDLATPRKTLLQPFATLR